MGDSVHSGTLHDQPVPDSQRLARAQLRRGLNLAAEVGARRGYSLYPRIKAALERAEVETQSPELTDEIKDTLPI